jgi:membrane dipeptidase
MVTFVPGFVDPEVAKITQPALEEFNRRSREAKSDQERQQLAEEIIGKLKLPPTTAANVADHIEHVRDIAGVEYIGIGGDFDGTTFVPQDLADVSMYPNLFAELMRRGWSDRDLKLVAGENLLRALGQAEAVAARLHAASAAR